MMKNFLWIVFLFSPIIAECQQRKFSHDKTQYIIDSFRLDSICILPPSVLCEKISTNDIIKLRRSPFALNIQSYAEDDTCEKKLSHRCIKEFDKYFRKVPHFITSLSFEDSVVINAEIKKIERRLEMEDLKSIKISDTLSGILSKYPGHQYLLTDIVDYTFWPPPRKFGDVHTKIQCFLIQEKSKQILFYDYRIWIHSNRRFKKVLKKIAKEKNT